MNEQPTPQWHKPVKSWMVSWPKAALKTLRLADRTDPLTELIAKKIIEVVRSGEHDPPRASVLALSRKVLTTPFIMMNVEAFLAGHSSSLRPWHSREAAPGSGASDWD